MTSISTSPVISNFVICFIVLSSGWTSRILLRILCCQWSKVWIPSPVGALRVVILSLLGGRGCGPFTLTPVLSAISLMFFATLLSCSRFVLVSLIRAYFGIILRGPLLDWILRDLLDRKLLILLLCRRHPS